MPALIRPAVASLVIAATALAGALPAAAQFGGIFGQPPPRPPGDVPRPQQYPQQQQYPPFPQQPGGPPPRGNVQSEPLQPPPGAAASPRGAGAPREQLPQNEASRPPGGALPGLPPGQRQPRGAPQPANPPPPQPANTAPQPGDEVITEPPAQKIQNAGAVFSGLDKITGRIINFDVAIGETVQFGALQVVPRACYTRPPTETPNTDAFVEVSEVTLQGDVRRIFGGWMFASSPGLHAVEHPIYDIWLTDCKGPVEPAVAAVEPAPPAAAAPARPAQQRRQPPPRQQPAPQPRAQQNTGQFPFFPQR